MRRKLVSGGSTKTFVMVFDSGEEVLEVLEAELESLGARSARFVAIGGFERATLAFFEMDEKRYRPIEVDEQLEVMSLSGNVTQLPDGERKIHAHVVVGKSDGTAHGGHLLRGIVRPTLELFLDVFPHPIERQVDAATGLPLIRP